MVTCDWVQENLTAWVDRELSEPEGDVVRRHVSHCARCAAESEELRRAVDLQRQLLGHVLAAGALETNALWRRVRSTLLEEVPTDEPWWARLRRPFAIASGALAAAVLVVIVAAGGPRALFILAGIESPPTAVAREPELFKDYPLIQQLDALEYFDTVESVPLDDEPTSQNG